MIIKPKQVTLTYYEYMDVFDYLPAKFPKLEKEFLELEDWIVPHFHLSLGDIFSIDKSDRKECPAFLLNAFDMMMKKFGGKSQSITFKFNGV